MADKLTIVFADPQELLGANDRIVFENDFDESIGFCRASHHYCSGKDGTCWLHLRFRACQVRLRGF